MTHFMLYGNVQSGIRSRDGKSTLKVDIFPEILLLIQNTSLPAPDINSFLSFLFLKKPVSRLLYISKFLIHPRQDGCVLYLSHFLLIFCTTGLKLSVRFRKKECSKKKKEEGGTIF